MTKRVVDPRFAKGSRYKKIIREIQKADVCPFCPENFRWHTKPILKRQGDWFITENFNPYKNAQYHFLAIKKTHKERLEELSVRDWKELSGLLAWTIKKYHLKGGGFAMRFGDTALTGATVCHIHAHLIVPKIKKGNAETVWFPIG
jgi:diadenosine tetraphosphate (Ap4A) HIT family hydrolase